MEREREQGSDRLDTEERKELNDSEFGVDVESPTILEWANRY